MSIDLEKKCRIGISALFLCPQKYSSPNPNFFYFHSNNVTHEEAGI